MSQGPGERRRIERAFRNNTPLPKVIQEAPELTLGLQLYLNAWFDLNSCRDSGWSPGPISWLDIHEYATVNEFDEDQREALHFHIPGMDTVYFEYLEQKREVTSSGKSK